MPPDRARPQPPISTEKIGWTVVILSILVIAATYLVEIQWLRTLGIIFLILGALLSGVKYNAGGPYGGGPDGNGGGDG
jgi:hypothetical protein